MLPSTPVFSPPWRTPIIKAVAVPDGNLSFSLTMTSFLKGTANMTPKKHNPSAQRISFPAGNSSPPDSCAVANAATMLGSVEAELGVSSFFSKNSSAGTTPTNPHPKGIVPTLPATVCTSTFSTSLNSAPHPSFSPTLPSLHINVRRPLKYAKPIKAEGIAMPDIHPVCKPK